MSQKQRSRAVSPSPSRKKSAPSTGVHAAITALEARLTQMEQSFNTNTKVFSDGIQMLEAQNSVLRKVIQDLYGRTTLGKNSLLTDAEGNISFSQYMSDFIAELIVRETLTDAKVEEAKTGCIQRSSTEVAEEVSVFGGSS